MIDLQLTLSENQLVMRCEAWFEDLMCSIESTMDEKSATNQNLT